MSVEKLFETVVDGGYCIGCGACASLTGSPIVIQMDEFSMLRATVDPHLPLSQLVFDVRKVCPFSEVSENEDEIGKRLYSSQAVYHDKIGYYLSTFAGYVAEEDYRINGSSRG